MEPSDKLMDNYLSEIARLFPRRTQNGSLPNITMSSMQEYNWQPRPILAKTHHDLYQSTVDNTYAAEYTEPTGTISNFNIEDETLNSKLNENIGRKIVGAKGSHANAYETIVSRTNTSLIPVYNHQSEHSNNNSLSSTPEYYGQTLCQDYSLYRQTMFPGSNQGNDTMFASLNSLPPSSKELCSFCRKNGETPLVYATHSVRTKVEGKTIVTCPILRSLVCTMCGASGDNAHTLTYCPLLRSANHGMPIQSTTIALKNTRVKSNGRRRY